MVRVGFYQGEALILSATFRAGQAPEFQDGDSSWLDLGFQPHSERLGRAVAFHEDSEEWARSLPSSYPPGASIEARVLEDQGAASRRGWSGAAGLLRRSGAAGQPRRSAAGGLPPVPVAQLAVSLGLALLASMVVFGLSDYLFLLLSSQRLFAVLLLALGLALPVWLARKSAQQLLCPTWTAVPMGLLVGLVAMNSVLSLEVKTLGFIGVSFTTEAVWYELPGGQRLRTAMVWTRAPGQFRIKDSKSEQRRRSEAMVRDRQSETATLTREGPLLAQWLTQYRSRHGEWDSSVLDAAAKSPLRAQLQSPFSTSPPSKRGDRTWTLIRADTSGVTLYWEGVAVRGVVSSSDGRAALFRIENALTYSGTSPGT